MPQNQKKSSTKIAFWLSSNDNLDLLSGQSTYLELEKTADKHVCILSLFLRQFFPRWEIEIETSKKYVKRLTNAR